MAFEVTRCTLSGDFPLRCSPCPLQISSVCTLFPCLYGRACFLTPGRGLWQLLNKSQFCVAGPVSSPSCPKPLWLSTDASQDEIICVWMSGRQHVYSRESLASDSVWQFSKFTFQGSEVLHKCLTFTFIWCDIFFCEVKGRLAWWTQYKPMQMHSAHVASS